MKYLSFFSIAVILFTSCNNDDTQKSTDNGNGKWTKLEGPKVARICFRGADNKDTILLEVTFADKAVSGNLEYNFFEKDKNTGTFKGEMRGDTLLANYLFLSEGVISTRQIIFLKNDNKMIEGYGEMEEKEGKMIFKNTNTVDFSKGIKLIPVDCKR